ncbi:deoxyguanosinetriphosphate triphosphohydrolase [Kibdelosporangium aridum]|uniref:Deoxyguanosinetriphosphate triphosphohydrolase n=1 Tax=Kibdelosporangium aridum TaxID=2030 RepID=A0A428ZIX7_KIBAR|nr:dNTP triphosphohydrolase [Kibdelosporangium aridum]RSM88039.1 deoxyguanosinetriphosphate triphosphohydrolase [Kibdelosporangium aridum]
MCATVEKCGDKRRYNSHDSQDYRSPFERDRDRILYSSAFRRLAGVTQVAAVSEQRVLHNRLTHSLKVAQMGRRLAQTITRDESNSGLAERAEVDADVVEAACLAHDLGHPPFGHVAESVLHERLQQVRGLDGFEGNAQSFRIVTKLARRRITHPGLNLTRAVLDAILKYPRSFGQVRTSPATLWTDRSLGGKWGVYESEINDFSWIRPSPCGQVRCANAVLMDWADDITFATHDIEDYYRAGLIPLGDLGQARAEILEHAVARLEEDHHDFRSADFKTALDDVISRFNGATRGSDWDTKENRAWLNKITSKNLTDLVGAVRVVDKPPYVAVDPDAQYLVEALKELTWYYVIDRPQLAMTQVGQKKLIGALYGQLCDCVRKDASSNRLPVVLREMYQDIDNDDDASPVFKDNESARIARAVADYICSLTECQAIDLSQRMNGTTRSSIFGAWFH